MVRRGYRTKARLFADDLTRLTFIRWYRALPGAKLLGVPCAINSAIWDMGDLTPLYYGVGEVRGYRPTFIDPNTVPRGLGLCRQGSDEQFARGILTTDVGSSKRCCKYLWEYDADLCYCNDVSVIVFAGELHEFPIGSCVCSSLDAGVNVLPLVQQEADVCACVTLTALPIP